MTRWRQAPWPVVFVVGTVLFAVLSLAWSRVDAHSARLAFGAPLFGAAMTWWLVRQRTGPRRP